MLLNIGSVNNSDKRYATITPLTSPKINPNIFENIPSTIVILQVHLLKILLIGILYLIL